MDRAYSPINNLLEQAACIARRSKETAGEIEPTEGYKRRQINELIKFTNNEIYGLTYPASLSPIWTKVVRMKYFMMVRSL